jgi:hypothetical protein
MSEGAIVRRVWAAKSPATIPPIAVRLSGTSHEGLPA